MTNLYPYPVQVDGIGWQVFWPGIGTRGKYKTETGALKAIVEQGHTPDCTFNMHFFKSGCSCHILKIESMRIVQ